MYKVYVKTDETGRIISVNSDAFLLATDGWIQIDEGEGSKYARAQVEYFDPPLLDDQACHNWKLVDGVPTLRTEEEKQAEISARPAPPKTPFEILRNDVDIILIDNLVQEGVL